jgi:hypothetical protein
MIEGKNPGEYLVHEESCDLSREKVTLSGGNHVDGTVLGKITASNKYVILAPGASDGSEVAAGILRGNTDASGGDVATVIHNALAKVRDENLTWPDGISAGEKTAAIAELAALHIKVQL